MPKVALSRLHTLQVLQLIRAQDSISRASLAEKTGTSPFLISKTCDQLLASKFISEAGQGDSTGGRRPTLLSLRPSFGRLIGVHLGAVNLRIAMTDFRGNLIEYVKGDSHAAEGPEVAMQHLIHVIDQMLQKTGVSPSELNGIGIGLSGVLQRKTGVTLFWPKLPLWINVPVKKILEDRYSTLVEIDDTSRTQAFAEYKLGALESKKHFVYVAMGAGIGAALFLDGRLYSGSQGFAGEFGHMTVSETGPLCSCGNRGCLETLISASALISKAQVGLTDGLSNSLMQLSRGNPKNLSVELLAEAARHGDRFTRRLIAETATSLGSTLVGLINLLNPELIVIGGGVASAIGEFMLPNLERIVRDRAMIQGDDQVEIRISTLEEKDWALGATLLVVEKALAQAFQKATEPKKRAIGKRAKAGI